MLHVRLRERLLQWRRRSMAIAKKEWRLLAIFAVYLALTLPWLDFVPFWDGGVYYQCVTEIFRKPFAIANLHCFNHPTLTHIAIVASAQALLPGNMASIYLLNIALALWAGVAFFRLTRMLVVADDVWLAPLATALFLFLPASVAHVFHLNPDTPMLFFWVIGLDFLVRRRFWKAAIAFVCMVFSKETGIPLLLLTCVLFAYFELWDPKRSRKRNIALLRSAEPSLFIPLLCFGAFLFIVHITAKKLLYWSVQGQTSTRGELFNLALDFNLGKPDMKAFLFDTFFLNFQWLLTALVITGVIHWVLTRARRTPRSLPVSRLFFLILLTIGTVYIVTRMRNWNNARYVMHAAVPLILCAIVAGRRLFSDRVLRVLFGGILALFLVSNVRTIDPLSLRMYGTLRFGTHAWLDRNSLYGPMLRDQNVYNLEFLQLHYLTQDAFRDLGVTEKMPLLTGRNGLFGLPGIDAATHTLVRGKAATPLRYFEWAPIPDGQLQYFRDAKIGLYLEYPNLDNRDNLRLAYSNYRFLWVRTYRRNGYELRVHGFLLPRP